MNIPVLYVGAPGIGKTEVTRQKYDHCEVLLLSSQTEEDIAGLPYREGSNERRTTPMFIERLQNAVKESKKTCLFLDELDKARREVADTLLTLVTHPGHFGIPECVEIIAAANPPEWGGGDGISDPMLSRFSVVEFEVNPTNWADFMKQKYQDIAHIENFVALFMEKQVPLLEATGEGLKKRLTCPRTIELSFKLIASEDPDLEKKVMGLVTPNVASAIVDFASELAGTKQNKIAKTARRVATNAKSVSKLLRVK